jgi:hypothetical protein
VSSLRPDIPEDIGKILTKALSLQPSDRFDNCGAFQVALSQALSKQAPEFTSASLAEWIRDLFSADITHEIEQRTVRDHLLEQLETGHGQESSGLSTGEILQMGTVSIQPKRADKGQKKTLMVVALTAFLAVIAIAAATLWLLRDRPTPGKPTPFYADGSMSADAGFASRDEGGNPEPGPQDKDHPRPDAGVGTGEKATTSFGDRTKPQPPADDSKTSKKETSQKWAFLNINASPWAFVEIDGKRQPKETPLFKIKVSPGRHRLRFINPALKIDVVRICRVRPGQTKTISVELDGER